MKLRAIAEAKLKGSRTLIRDTATIFGDLIKYITKLGHTPESEALTQFLAAPDARSWERTKWIIDAAVRRAETDPSDANRAVKWANLKQLTAPVLAAAIYDIDPKYVKNTPLQKIALSKQIRDKYKAALGPQGYVSTMANADTIPPTKLRDMLKTTAKSGVALAKAGRTDLPSIKPVTHF